jgi:hypothetical protein
MLNQEFLAALEQFNVPTITVKEGGTGRVEMGVHVGMTITKVTADKPLTNEKGTVLSISVILDVEGMEFQQNYMQVANIPAVGQPLPNATPLAKTAQLFEATGLLKLVDGVPNPAEFKNAVRNCEQMIGKKINAIVGKDGRGYLELSLGTIEAHVPGVETKLVFDPKYHDRSVGAKTPSLNSGTPSQGLPTLGGATAGLPTLGGLPKLDDTSFPPVEDELPFKSI